MGLPFFNMYPTDFEADTSHLTLAEDGAYNRLLRLMWMMPGCSLPDDDAWIMRRMRCTCDDDRSVVLSVLGEFFERDGKRLSNARLSAEFAKSSEAHAKRVNAGSKGGKAKPLAAKGKASSNAQAKPKQPEPKPEPKPIREEGTNVPLAIVPSKPKTDGADFAEFWDRYPRKVGKDAARKAFAKAMKTARPDDVMFGLSQQLPSLQSKDPQFIPHAASWLNQGRWTDEQEQPNDNPRNRAPDATTRAIDVASRFIRTPSLDSF
jgi:uncharacterized protein YdaU (DUF1376 family)